jgi:uncharacterized protein YkwD
MHSVTSLEKSKKLSYEVWKFQNAVRQNPAILLPLLEQDLKNFRGSTIWTPGEPGLLTQEGPSAWHEAIRFIKVQRPLRSLEWNDSLAAPAVDHAYDLGPKGGTGHVGSDRSTMSDRIERHGKWLVTIAENVFCGKPDPQEIIKQLIVDDGVASRGHRDNIFHPEFGVVGIGAAPHINYGCICVLDYAGGMAPGGTAAYYAPAVAPAVFGIAARSEAGLADARAKAQGMPAGCVSRSTEIQTRTVGPRRTVTTTTVYTFADGHKETRVDVEES